MSDNKYRFTGKYDISSLGDIPQFFHESIGSNFSGQKGLYQFSLDGFVYHVLFSPVRPDAPEEEKRRLFLIFSGHADRQKLRPPIFQRWKWADRFPGHCLYISDPTLHLDERIGLAWYAGTKDYDVLPRIAEIVSYVANGLNISLQNVVSYASSGGGFAALRLASMMPALTTIAINPQIDVTKYHVHSILDDFLRVSFEGMSASDAASLYSDRLNIVNHVDKLRESKIVYAQNLLDRHHTEVHFSEFSAAFGLNEESEFQAGRIRAYLFSLPGGHGQAETSEIFNDLMRYALPG